jgi:hypothetical protein
VAACRASGLWSFSNPLLRYPILYASVIREEPDVEILDSIPPPQLHLHMGGTNSAMDAIMELWGETELLAWCKKNFIMKRGYQGLFTGSFPYHPI